MHIWGLIVKEKPSVNGQWSSLTETLALVKDRNFPRKKLCLRYLSCIHSDNPISTRVNPIITENICLVMNCKTIEKFSQT